MNAATRTEARPGTWLAQALAVLGEPRIKFADARIWTDAGSVNRTGWVWFPDGKNMGTHIDRGAGSMTVTAWSHASNTWAEIRQPGTEVTDEQIRALLVLAWGSDWTQA